MTVIVCLPSLPSPPASDLKCSRLISEDSVYIYETDQEDYSTFQKLFLFCLPYSLFDTLCYTVYRLPNNLPFCLRPTNKYWCSFWVLAYVSVVIVCLTFILYYLPQKGFIETTFRNLTVHVPNSLSAAFIFCLYIKTFGSYFLS